MKKTILYLAIFTILAAVGCEPVSLTFSQTSKYQWKQRPKKCDYDFLLTRPNRRYEEIGAIDVTDCPPDDTCRQSKLMRHHFRRHVCKHGGDAVIVGVNGKGEYIKAVVIKYLPKRKLRK